MKIKTYDLILRFENEEMLDVFTGDLLDGGGENLANYKPLGSKKNPWEIIGVDLEGTESWEQWLEDTREDDDIR